ncbi:MAG TPA: ROK family protein [Steroidobacteraceae bacterium]|nr:ROK family protein [Steroidobacteraceae bacterium]
MADTSRRRTVRGERRARRERCVLGIDVGGTNIRAGLFNPRDGSLHCVRSARTEAMAGALHALMRVVDLAGRVAEQGRAAGLIAHRVGIGIPELVGPDQRIESQCSLHWSADQVRASLAAHGEVTIVSDVLAASVAEARLGAGRGHRVFLYVTVGTGISCALVIDGKPFTGAHGHAISFASGPTAAALGAPGTAALAPLESLASGPGILRRAKDRGLTEPDTIAICRTALEGPGPAREIVDAAATELAIHVAILANMLDPTLVVLGGGLGCSSGRYWSTFRAALPRYTCGPHMPRLRVCRARLGTRAGMIGAAQSALEARA